MCKSHFLTVAANSRSYAPCGESEAYPYPAGSNYDTGTAALCISLLPIRTEKTIQGISDSNEKINPNVPAVDGINIKIPAINPHVAVDFPKSFDLYIVVEIIRRVMAFKT